MKILSFAGWLLYKCIINAKRITLVVMGIYILCLLFACKSVEKSQSSKTDTAKVTKSDSSKSASYTFSDTTKTDSSTEIHTYTVTIDSIEYNHIPKGDTYEWNTPHVGVSRITPVHQWLTAIEPAKAKGVKIVSTTIKQAAIVSKGVSIKSDSTQKNIKSDSAIVKTEQIKTVVKKAHPVKMILGVTLGIIIIGCILYLWLVVYKKKKQIITGLI